MIKEKADCENGRLFFVGFDTEGNSFDLLDLSFAGGGVELEESVFYSFS